MKWQEEALTKNRVIVRATRQAGKTYTAVKWARNAGKEVLFGVPYKQMVSPVVDLFKRLYQEEIELAQRNTGRITFLDGTHIQVAALQNEFSVRGKRVDAVVLDDVGEMNEDAVVSAMMCAAHVRDFKFFAAYSVIHKNGIKRIERLESVSSVDHIVVDYLDLLEEGVVTAEQMRQIWEMYTPSGFGAEFGPYLKDRPKNKMTNKLFKHLLNKKAD